MKKNLIEIYIQDFDKVERPFVADWNLPRKFVTYWYTEKQGEEAAEEAFHVLNAPDEILTESEKDMRKEYKGPSLSVGDIVRVINTETEEYLCASFGWERR